MSKKCPNCSLELVDDGNFCMSCGAKLDAITENSDNTTDDNDINSRANEAFRGLSAKIAIFSAIIATLGYFFINIDKEIGTLVYVFSVPLLIVSIISVIYNLIFGKAPAYIKVCEISLYVAITGSLLGEKTLLTAGMGICFIIVALTAFNKIFLNKWA